MSDQIQDEPQDDVQPDELTVLKERARKAGLKFHPSIGLEALREKLTAHLNDEPAPAEESAPAASPATVLSEKARIRREVRADALKLVRLRITNLNPLKKDLHGEIFTVANEIVGDVKKYIPYGEVTEEGYHVPNIIYKQLKARKFLQIKTRKDREKPGNVIVDQKWVPEFALEVLPQLTQVELEALANAQRAAGSIN
jgi:hypothetical protein